MVRCEEESFDMEGKWYVAFLRWIHHTFQNPLLSPLSSSILAMNLIDWPCIIKFSCDRPNYLAPWHWFLADFSGQLCYRRRTSITSWCESIFREGYFVQWLESSFSFHPADGWWEWIVVQIHCPSGLSYHQAACWIGKEARFLPGLGVGWWMDKWSDWNFFPSSLCRGYRSISGYYQDVWCDWLLEKFGILSYSFSVIIDEDDIYVWLKEVLVVSSNHNGIHSLSDIIVDLRRSWYILIILI